jgi:hypothetical protein
MHAEAEPHTRERGGHPSPPSVPGVDRDGEIERMGAQRADALHEGSREHRFARTPRNDLEHLGAGREHLGAALRRQHVNAREGKPLAERAGRGNDGEQIDELARGHEQDVPRAVERLAEAQRLRPRPTTEHLFDDVKNEGIECLQDAVPPSRD